MKTSRIVQAVILIVIFLVSSLLFWSGGDEGSTTEGVPAGYQAQP